VIFTDEQREFVNEQVSRVDLNDEKWEPLPKHSNVFVKLSKIRVEGESVVMGKAEAIIDKTPERVLAYFWDYCW